jgi:hypothetical protein
MKLDHSVGHAVAPSGQLKFIEGSLMGINHQLVHAYSHDKELLVHELIVEDTSQLLKACSCHEHLYCIRIPKVQVRFERAIELSDSKVKFNKRGRTIIDKVDLL